MEKKIIIDRDKEKDFYQEIKSYINKNTGERQFIRNNMYYAAIEEVYKHYFALLTDASSIEEIINAGADIYRDLNKLNRRLNVTEDKDEKIIDGYLLHLVVGQILSYFSGNENLQTEKQDTMINKIRENLGVSTTLMPLDRRRGKYIKLNHLILEKGIRQSDLEKRTGLSRQILVALRSGRKKLTKDICYILALAMHLNRAEFIKFAKHVNKAWEFDTERDELILSHMHIPVQLQRMPENKGKTEVQVINELLEQHQLPVLSVPPSCQAKMADVRTILITGGTGFIGKNCIKYFEERNNDADCPFTYRICVLSTAGLEREKDLRDNAKLYKNTAFYRWKLNDPLVYERILLENDVDYIIHLSAIPIPQNAKKNANKTISVNAEILNALCGVIENNEIPIKGLIFPSTEQVYWAAEGSWKEGAHIDVAKLAQYPYAASKHIAEQIAWQYAKKFPVVVARLSNIYGEYDNHIEERLIPKTVYRLIKGLNPELYVDPRTGEAPGLDLLYVKDVARAFESFLMELESNAGFYDPQDIVYNVGSGAQHTVDEIQNIIIDLLGMHDVKIKEIEEPVVRRSSMDISKMRKKCKFGVRTDLREGLMNTIAWYQLKYKSGSASESDL